MVHLLFDDKRGSTELTSHRGVRRVVFDSWVQDSESTPSVRVPDVSRPELGPRLECDDDPPPLSVPSLERPDVLSVGVDRCGRTSRLTLDFGAGGCGAGGESPFTVST